MHWLFGLFWFFTEAVDYNVGLLEIGDANSRLQIIQAFLLAIEDTNFDNQNSNFQLRGVVSLVPETGNSTQLLLTQGRTLTADPTLVALTGSWSDDFTIDSQVISKGSQKPYIGYKSESTLLADQKRYPYFLRVNPSEVQQSMAMAQFIYAMQWQRVGLISGPGAKSDVFLKVARARGVDVIHNALLESSSQAACQAALAEVQQKGATIFVLSVDAGELQSLVNAAATMGVLNSFYQFLVLSDTSSWGMELMAANVRSRYESLIGLRWKTDTRFTTFSDELNKRISNYQRIVCTVNSGCPSKVCGPQGLCMGYGKEGANIYAGFAADAIALLSACIKLLLDNQRSPLDGASLAQACRESAQPVLGFTSAEFKLDSHGNRWMNVSIVNVQQENIVPIATWTAPQGASEADWTGTECNPWEVLPSDLGKMDLLCQAPDTQCTIQWPSPSLGRPTGASTYLNLGVLAPDDSDAMVGDWIAAIGEAVQEINNSTLALSQGGSIPNLRLLPMNYDSFADLLRTAGDLVKSPLLAAVLGPPFRVDEPLITVNSVSQITTAAGVPQIDYSSSGSFFTPTTNRDEYPFYVSLVPSDILAGHATVAILEKYQWMNVVLITSTVNTNRRPLFDSLIANSEILLMAAIQIAPADSRVALDTKIKQLKSTGARTVVCWLDSPDVFRSVFDAAFRGGFTNSQNITWIVPSLDITESIWMNKELRSPYSPRMLVEMQSLLCLSIPSPSPGPASPAPVVSVSSAFDSANSVSARVKFARDAVYLLAMAIATTLRQFKDPTNGPDLVAAMRNHTYDYAITFTGKAQRGERDYSGTRYRTSITIDALGDRILPLAIKNMDTEGELNDVGTYDPRATPPLSFFTDVVFVGGRTSPLKNFLCSYEFYYDEQTRACKACVQPAYAFDEKLWQCGEPRPEELSLRATTIAIVFWLCGLVALAFLLSCGYWRYSIYTTEVRTPSDWRTKASNDLARGLRLDILMTSCSILSEAFDLITNWILAFYFIDVRIQEFLWITLFYFLFLAVNTILSVVYIYHLCIALHEVVIDLHKGVKTLDDNKLAALTESRMAGDRRTSVWGNNPMTAKLRTEHFMTTAKLMLVLAFVEDAVTVIFGAIYLKYLGLQVPLICIISIAWSLLAFGQKIGAWKDLMYLTEKHAWLITTENMQSNRRRGKRLSKGISGPLQPDIRPELKILADIKREQELKKSGDGLGPHSPLLSKHGSQDGREPAEDAQRRAGSLQGSKRHESLSTSGNPTTRNRRGMDLPPPPSFSRDENEAKSSYNMERQQDDAVYDEHQEYGGETSNRYEEAYGEDEEEELMIPEVEDMHEDFQDDSQGDREGDLRDMRDHMRGEEDRGFQDDYQPDTPPRPATAYDSQVYDGYDPQPHDVVFHGR